MLDNLLWDKIMSNIFKNHTYPNSIYGLNYYPIKSWDFLKVDAYFINCRFHETECNTSGKTRNFREILKSTFLKGIMLCWEIIELMSDKKHLFAHYTGYRIRKYISNVQKSCMLVQQYQKFKIILIHFYIWLAKRFFTCLPLCWNRDILCNVYFVGD